MTDASRYYAVEPSPVGDLLVVGDGEAITAVYFHGRDRRGPVVRGGWRRDRSAVAAASEQLQAYFAGERRSFDVPLAPAGTPFQLRVWRAVTEIPYGRTMSYGALAGAIGHPGSARAVGAANGRNPIPILIPCHRLLGADRSLTGYGGGLDAKRALLVLEGALIPELPPAWTRTLRPPHGDV